MTEYAHLSYEEWDDLGRPSRTEYETQTAALDGVRARLAEQLRAEVQHQERQLRAELKRQATALYGRSGTGGMGPGSAMPSRPVTPEQAIERWQGQFAEEFNSAPRDRYGQRQGLNPHDVDRYASTRFTSH